MSAAPASSVTTTTTTSGYASGENDPLSICRRAWKNRTVLMRTASRPAATSRIPIGPEYGGSELAEPPPIAEISRRKRPKRATTKPRPISAIAVLTHASSVRSLARCSRALVLSGGRLGSSISGPDQIEEDARARGRGDQGERDIPAGRRHVDRVLDRAPLAEEIGAREQHQHPSRDGGEDSDEPRRLVLDHLELGQRVAQRQQQQPRPQPGKKRAHVGEVVADAYTFAASASRRAEPVVHAQLRHAA